MKRVVGVGSVLGALSVWCLAVAGCGPMPGEKKLIDVEAEYLGLEGQRVAVLVAADSHMQYQYPDAQDNVCRAMTSRISKGVAGVTTTIPDDVAEFLEANPYWMNMRYGELAERLDVDKIVLVDLIEYQTHEPGNAHIWQGLITGNVGVIDANSPDPDNFVFQNTVSAMFPEESSVGVIDADNESIQIGMVFIFSKRGAGLFYDHQAEVDY
jgi:hypothetical protein